MARIAPLNVDQRMWALQELERLDAENAALQAEIVRLKAEIEALKALLDKPGAGPPEGPPGGPPAPSHQPDEGYP
jgi:uncharacterized small protein (DUF1192 family)